MYRYKLVDELVTFQSTPLVRGETGLACFPPALRQISIHSPRARGDNKPLPCSRCRKISIHSPRARGDGFEPLKVHHQRDFNPLPSCEGRPPPCGAANIARNFNPLPSCEGRRRAFRAAIPGLAISIHSPRARGDYNQTSMFAEHLPFQSTPLVRGETTAAMSSCEYRQISIHSPRARGDPLPDGRGFFSCISIHSPRARGDDDRR